MGERQDLTADEGGGVFREGGAGVLVYGCDDGVEGFEDVGGEGADAGGEYLGALLVGVIGVVRCAVRCKVAVLLRLRLLLLGWRGGGVGGVAFVVVQ